MQGDKTTHLSQLKSTRKYVRKSVRKRKNIYLVKSEPSKSKVLRTLKPKQSEDSLIETSNAKKRSIVDDVDSDAENVCKITENSNDGIPNTCLPCDNLSASSHEDQSISPPEKLLRKKSFTKSRKKSKSTRLAVSEAYPCNSTKPDGISRENTKSDGVIRENTKPDEKIREHTKPDGIDSQHTKLDEKGKEPTVIKDKIEDENKEKDQNKEDKERAAITKYITNKLKKLKSRSQIKASKHLQDPMWGNVAIKVTLPHIFMGLLF